MTELKQKFVCFDCLDDNGKLVLHRYEGERTGPGRVIAAMCKRQYAKEMAPGGSGEMLLMRRVQEWPETA